LRLEKSDYRKNEVVGLKFFYLENILITLFNMLELLG